MRIFWLAMDLLPPVELMHTLPGVFHILFLRRA